MTLDNFLALAVTGGKPTASSAGQEKKLPPPAMALRLPARKALAATSRQSDKVIRAVVHKNQLSFNQQRHQPPLPALQNGQAGA